MKTLHILNKSPSHSRFAQCLQSLADADQLLLIEDAVVGLAMPGLTLPADCFALRADLEARALAHLDATTVVDYPDMVELTVAADRVISW